MLRCFLLLEKQSRTSETCCPPKKWEAFDSDAGRRHKKNACHTPDLANVRHCCIKVQLSTAFNLERRELQGESGEHEWIW